MLQKQKCSELESLPLRFAQWHARCKQAGSIRIARTRLQLLRVARDTREHRTTTEPLLPMNRIVSVALLIAGLVLLFFGFGAADSLSSEVSEAVTGTPTDRSIWLIVLGVIATLIGGLGLIRRRA